MTSGEEQRRAGKAWIEAVVNAYARALTLSLGELEWIDDSQIGGARLMSNQDEILSAADSVIEDCANDPSVRADFETTIIEQVRKLATRRRMGLW